MRNGFRWLAVSLAAAACLGCGKASPEPSANSVVAEGGVIAFGPSLTEIVYALGHGDRVVGVSSFVSYPTEALALPNVGGMIDPNLERIAALQPRLVLLSGRVPLIEQLSLRSGFVTHDAKMDTLAEIETGVRDLARVLGDAPAGDRLWAQMRQELDAIEAEASQKSRRSVLIVMNRSRGNITQLFTTGGASFVHELVELAGGDNIFVDATQPYLEAPKERILARAPEVILELHPGLLLDDDTRARMLDEWQSMPTVPAVRTGQVHLLTEDYLLIPGPRIGQTARRILEALHSSP